MTPKDHRRGYTLIEFLVVLFIINLLIIVPTALLLLKGNFYYTSDGVLRELQVDRPNVARVLKTERNVISFSKIYVEESGTTKIYLLDTNVMFNYRFRTAD